MGASSRTADLAALLRRPPPGIQVTAGANEIRLRYRRRGRPIEPAYRSPLHAVVWVFGGSAVVTVALVALMFAVPEAWFDAVLWTTAGGAIAAVAGWALWLWRERPVEIVVLPGQIRIGPAWERPLRDLQSATYEVLEEVDGGSTLRFHTARIVERDGTGWLCTLDGGEVEARWVAELIQARVLAARADTGGPPEALTELVDRV